MNEIRFNKETTEKLDTMIECFQLVLEQIYVKHNTDIHMMRRQMRKELLEEIKQNENISRSETR
jgi:hypothetical protein